jgi:hypothetical protein
VLISLAKAWLIVVHNCLSKLKVRDVALSALGQFIMSQ